MNQDQTNSQQIQPLPSIDPILDQAVAFLTTPGVKPPAPSAVVAGLLMAEKTAKRTKLRYAYPQLQGTWRLGLITGTKRSRQKAGVILGVGRFLPAWVKIHLSYSQLLSDTERGTVKNLVELGLLQLVLTGPTQWNSQTNRLAFDFTQIKVSLSGFQLYSGYIRGGQEREVNFYQQSVKEQAFFTYFLVQDRYIAARGRGGGLALWTRVNDS